MSIQAVIHPVKGIRFYQGLLILTKLLKVFAYFFTHELLKCMHGVSFLLFLKLCAVSIILPLQKPFAAGRMLTRSQCFQIARYSVVKLLVEALWIEGIYLCGPFRSIMLFEHSELLVLGALSAVFYGSSSASKTRGALFFILGVISVALFDHDKTLGRSVHPEGVHKSLLIHKIYELFLNFGLSDHKVGVVILFMATCLDAGCAVLSRKLVSSVGGAKRLHAFSSIFSFWILLPVFLTCYLYGIRPLSTEELLADGSLAGNILSSPKDVKLIPWLVRLIFVGVTFVVDFYFTSIVSARLGAQTTTRLVKFCVVLSAFVLCLFWFPNLDSPWFPGKLSSTDSLKTTDSPHVLSSGVLFALISILYATNLLTNAKPGQGPDGASSGLFVGYSMSGLPLFTAGQTPTHGVALLSHPETAGLWYHIQTTVKGIMSEKSSRRIFAFLCLNLVFTFVELLYGVWTNSLGLISDGFHMLFDSAALVIGLYAAVVSHWEPTRLFSFGFHRAEVLSGFVNAVFLLVISGSVFVNALARMHHPPHIHTDRLMVVSVAGLLVNLVGIMALGHAHSHGGRSCGSGHGHSHASDQLLHYGHAHGHKRQAGGHHHAHEQSAADANLRGVYLHVLADTLGSVGVIFSSYLVSTHGWNIADPICSVFIACAIGYSALPLLSDTLNLLTLRAPKNGCPTDPEWFVQKVLAVDSVLAVYNPFIWSLTRDTTCLSMCVQVEPEATEQWVLVKIKELVTLHCPNVTHLTVQIEKDTVQYHLHALGLKPAVLLSFSQAKNCSAVCEQQAMEPSSNEIGQRLQSGDATVIAMQLL